MRQVHRTGAFLLLGLAVALGGVPGLEAQELTRTLTAEQVGCNDDQLERLLYRSHLAPERAGKLQSLFVSYNELSAFEGVGISQPNRDGNRSPDAFLSFHLNPDVRPHLINPRRPPIEQISLTREEASSNLVPPSAQDAMTLQVNPLAVVAGNPPWSEPGVLRINNFTAAAPGAPGTGHLTSDVKPGRGLENDGLLTVCHTRFTDFDRWVLSILQRTLVIVTAGGAGPEDFNSEVAVFRDQDPHTFRINIYPGSAAAAPDTNRLAVRLRVDWTPDGRLTTGVIEALPRCTGSGQEDCTTELGVEEVRVSLTTPISGLNESRPFPRYGFTYTGAPAAARADVDFAQLLFSTRWNDGGWEAPES